MTEGDAVVGAVTETTVFLSYFKDLPDYRQKGKVAYPLEEVLLLMLAAALAGAETVADMARFGRAKLRFFSDSDFSRTARPRTTSWASSSPGSIRSRSNAVLWRGRRR